MSQEVVVTGVGMSTPVGGDTASSWAAVLAGTSGISRLDADWIVEQPSQIVGLVAVDPTEVLDRVDCRGP
jgi:3-oxoacyl-[acyl-carrier-protein] synthase II